MKKFLTAFLAVICFVCLFVAAACTTKYYTLTFTVSQGITVESELSSGTKVKDGYEVKFKLVVGEDIQYTPDVKVNGDILQPGADGVYKFKIKEDTVVEATIPAECTVTFDRESNDWIDFLSVEGESLNTLDLVTGDTVKFKVHKSIYYGDSSFTVTATVGNTKLVVSPDSEGVYSYDIQAPVRFTVSDLTVDDSFLSRENSGSGTATDPYKIERPIDLYAMSDLISTVSEQNNYNTAYYSLENDIDMQGERVFVIGDSTTTGSVFAGNFNGNGHTISNYYINDQIVEQSEYQRMHLQYVGLFGYAVTNQAQGTEIRNLNLKGFTITSNGAEFDSPTIVGGLVGYGIGVNITNCSAEGTIVLDGDRNYFAYAGGLIGLQSSYASASSRFYSVVQSCSTDVDINAKSGLIYAAGGIVSAMSPFDERTPTIVLNCYSSGDIGNALRVGGIVGQINEYGSVKNCYAEGTLEAVSRLMKTEGVEQYSYAYAGGIVGHADFGTVVSDCFFTGKTYAFAVEDDYAAADEKYSYCDGIVGGIDVAGTDYIQSEAAVVFNCHSSQASRYNDTPVASFTDSFIQNSIGWSDKDWSFTGNGKPVINQAEESKSFTVTVNLGTYGTQTLSVSDMYYPMAYWYDAEDGLPEFVSKGEGMRTFGYYFDDKLTQRVPCGYVPTDSITLYAGFADYREVAGEYRLALGIDYEAKFELTAAGEMIYREGALSNASSFVYNGDYIILYDTMIASLVDSEYEFYTFKAELKDGVMSIYDNTVFPASAPLLALKILGSFNYGNYYDANGSQYSFSADGTGVITELIDSAVSRNITWQLDGTALKITMDGVSISGTVGQDGYVSEVNNMPLSRFDYIKGIWEKAATSHKQYEFDGISKWTFKSFGYDKNGKEIAISSARGSYTLDSHGVISLDNGTELTFKDGVLEVSGENYYRQNSFVGEWLYAGFGEPVIVTFNGIGADGYGKAVMDYGTVSGKLDVNYESYVQRGVVCVNIYYEYAVYAQLEYNPGDNTLTGIMFSVKENDMVEDARLCIYDDFRGTWTSDVLNRVTFNGLGYYNFGGSASYTPVRGSVTVNGASAGAYTLKDGMLKGSFSYGGKTYDIEYNDADGCIDVECEGQSFKLVKV